MRRLLLLALFALWGAGTASADDGPGPSGSKPPWQRLLTGADARKAAALAKQRNERAAADDYAAALAAGEELLALRLKVQGADHWQVANTRAILEALRKVAALSVSERAGWRKAEQGARLADLLEDKARYAQALPLRRNRLQWRQRVLGEDHPDTANSYNNVAVNLQYQAQYAQAAPLFQKALDIRRQVLGEDHPDTANSYSHFARNLQSQARYAEAAPLLQKALDIYRQVLGEDHPYTATSYINVAYNLNAQGQYSQAAPLYQKALDICRKVLGDDHPQTATSYNNLAANLQSQARYAEAAPLLQKALDIRHKVLGEDHPDTATSYNNLANNLNAQGQYAQAAPLYQKALDICRKVLGEDHPQTATSYNNLAYNLNNQGQFAQAAPLYQKALAIRRQILGEDHPQTATSYNNVAHNLQSQARSVEAAPLYQKALDIYRKVLGEGHPHTADSYNNVADNLNAQGQYSQAAPLFQKALDIYRKVLGDDHPGTANCYHNVAGNLDDQGQYTQAAPLFQKALDIRRKVLGEDHPRTAASYHNVAVNLQVQARYAEAAPLYQKALDILRKVLGEDHPDTATSYINVAYNLAAQGQYSAARAALQAAAKSYETARLAVAVRGLERAVFGAKSSPYPLLATCCARAGRPREAWAALEADLARGLLDESASRRGQGLTEKEQKQRLALQAHRVPLDRQILGLVSRTRRSDQAPGELKPLLEQRRQLEAELAELAAAVSRREVATLAQVQGALAPEAALVVWVDAFSRSRGVQEHWACVLRASGEPRWQRLPGSGVGGAWTQEDYALPGQLRQALGQAAPAEQIDTLVRKLRAQRLDPLAAHLAGVNRLIVVPVHGMAGLPVEVLTDQFTVSYTPSGTHLARGHGRPTSQGSALLAVGDPVFPPRKDKPPPTALPPGGLLVLQVLPGGNAARARVQPGDVLVAYAGQDLTSAEQLGQLVAAHLADKSVPVKLWREGQESLAERALGPGQLGVALAKAPAREVISARRQADQMLARLSRGDDFAELPGAQVEIKRLAELLPTGSVTTLTRAEATEQRLDELRRAGSLKSYRYLHLATHGQANNVRSFESALILTRPGQVPPPRVGEPWLDGRLTADEVLEYWQLDADLVTLSACESGLGRPGGGDGLLGFAQAFLLAGSRSVCLTLWKVDDTATALLMDRFYRNLLGQRENGAGKLGKAAALREAKQWLRTLPASAALARLGVLTEGLARGERPARQLLPEVPKAAEGVKDHAPYAHPRYWAAFVLFGASD